MDFSLKLFLQYALAIMVCSLVLFQFFDYRNGLKDELVLKKNTFTKLALVNEECVLEVQTIVLKVNQTYDLKDYISKSNGQVSIYDEIDITKPGLYPVRYVCVNSNGQYKEINKLVRVER